MNPVIKQIFNILLQFSTKELVFHAFQNMLITERNEMTEMQ